jgi:serine/threonine protein kinase
VADQASLGGHATLRLCCGRQPGIAAAAAAAAAEVSRLRLPHLLHVVLLQEYLPGGPLSRVLLADMGRSIWARSYSLTDSIRWAMNIAEALDYLHNHNPKVRKVVAPFTYTHTRARA